MSEKIFKEGARANYKGTNNADIIDAHNASTVSADTAGGNDVVRIQRNVIGTTDVNINTGKGNDQVSIDGGNRQILGSISGRINLGTGNDWVDINVGGQAGGAGSKLEIDGGPGKDTVAVGIDQLDMKLHRNKDGSFTLSDQYSSIKLKGFEQISLSTADGEHRKDLASLPNDVSLRKVFTGR